MPEVASIPKTRFYKGEGAISVLFEPPESEGGAKAAYVLVYIRVHFRLLSGSGEMQHITLALDSFQGEEYDVQLFQARNRGVGADANLLFPHDRGSGSSPWSFKPGDKLSIAWPGSANVGWGLEVGYDL